MKLAISTSPHVLLLGLLILALTPSAQGELIGHWKLDDRGSAAEVIDSSANALHGTLNGETAGRSRPGCLGASLDFSDGGIVDLASHAEKLGQLKDFTLSMWIQHQAGGGRILFSWSDDTLNHRVQVESNGDTLSFGWMNGGVWQAFATAPLAWEEGVWYHVVFVNDSARGKTIFRSNDGVLVTNANTFGPADLAVPVTQVQIGGLGGAYHFGGLIDDVRLYDVALRPIDFRALYRDKPISGKPSFQLGHWKLDDKAPSADVVDSSPNELHGVFNAETEERSREGRLDAALDFREGAIVDLTSHAEELRQLKDFTLSMWIQHSPGGSRILFSWSDDALNYRIQVESHVDTLSFGWLNGGSWQAFATEPLDWEEGEWYHVVFVNDSVRGKTILRSNDGVWTTNASTFAPADLGGAVTQVQIGGLGGGYPFGGAIDDVRLYDIALCENDLQALYEDKPISGKPPYRPSLAELSTLEKDWYFQTENRPFRRRALAEIGWAEEMVAHMKTAGVALETLGDEISELETLKQKAQEFATLATGGPSAAWELYLAVRQVKRRLMFKRPEVDFDQVVFVDVPYPRGEQWLHESRYHSNMVATHGGELFVLQDLTPDGDLQRLAPDKGRVTFMRPDVSHDGQRVLFSMKPEEDRSYHLYEINADGADVRQLTSGSYSDIDPIYLPDDNIAFLTTRGNTYGGCAPWAPQHILARSDGDGKNIYFLGLGSEPDFSPSVLDDGRLIYTRWEYNDKALNRIQSLWTMNPDGTASSTYWGNQSVFPDHLGEARSIPGSPLVMFTAMGHHDLFSGSIGILDTTKGLNYPDGIQKVTMEMPWPEGGDGPVAAAPFTNDYHVSGPFGAYKAPYPLSSELFLVSARNRQRYGKFKLYLMDIYGNRELIYEGNHNVLYGQPIRARKRPPVIPSMVAELGREADGKTPAPAYFYCADVYEGMPEEIRGKGKYLRVIENVQRVFTTGCVDGGGSPFGSGSTVALDSPGLRNGNPTKAVVDVAWGDGAILAGPATAISTNTRLKRVLGIVPVAEDGSYYFEAPPGKALYFQLLDENKLVLQSMRSWVNLMPGERRGCVGCHEGRNNTLETAKSINFAYREPDQIEPPSWGVKTLSYVDDIQPIFDRNCAECHQGEGKAREKLDLTLRPDKHNRWGGIFPEPYITLTCGDNAVGIYAGSHVRPTIAGNFFIWSTSYETMPAMTKWSYRSPLINLVMHGNDNHDLKLSEEELGILTAWVDTNCHFRSLKDVLDIDDPDPNWFLNWPFPPQLSSAPYVNRLYSQEEFNSPSDRATLRSRYPSE